MLICCRLHACLLTHRVTAAEEPLDNREPSTVTDLDANALPESSAVEHTPVGYVAMAFHQCICILQSVSQ